MHPQHVGAGHGVLQTEQVRGANTRARVMEMESVLIIGGRKQLMVTVSGGCVHVSVWILIHPGISYLKLDF